jgi:hypothetical protein
MCKNEETRPVPLAERNENSWNKHKVLLLAERNSNVTDKEEEAYERMWRFYEGRGGVGANCRLQIWYLFLKESQSLYI